MSETKEPTLRDHILRRLFRNPKGDWKKTEKLCRECTETAEKLQATLEQVVELENSLKDLLLKAYTSAPAIDSLYMDSPVAPHKVTLQSKLYMKKLGWTGAPELLTPSITVEPFAKTIKDCCKWLMKFKDNEN